MNYKTRLGHGLLAWTTYEFNCKRGRLFSEAYLTKPIGELLNAWKPDGAELYAEDNHSILINNRISEIGRPPQVDFVLKKGPEIILALEAKWTIGRDISAELSWEVLRLRLIAEKWPQAECFLVLAGTTQQFKKVFKEACFGLPTEPRAGHRTIRPSTFSGKTKTFVNQKKNKYQGIVWQDAIPVDYPMRFDSQTKLPFSVAIWRIRQ